MKYATVALLALLASPAAAEPLRVQTVPGHVTILESGTVVATTSVGETGSASWDADPGAPHEYVLRRPPFEDRPLTATWDETLHRWRLDRALADGAVIALDRRIALNVSPSPDAVYVDAVQGGIPLVVAGLEHHVVPLPMSGGTVLVPHAWAPPPLFLQKARFAVCGLQFQSGDLALDVPRLPAAPVRLTPLYGPFSYPAADASLAFLSLGAAGYWYGASRRRRREALLAQRREAVEQSVEAAGPTMPLAGAELLTDNQRRLVLIRELGRGGAGVVYEALPAPPESPEPRYAVKLLTRARFADPSAQQRFEQEIRILCSLSHRNVVKLFDWGTLPVDFGGQIVDLPFMVMERLSGETLRAIMDRAAPQPIDVDQVLTWMTEILYGLRAAHQVGVVHRDLKPENLMVTASGHVKVMDFGIARQVEAERITATNLVVGTPRYMSPEHFVTEGVVPQSDLYSLGAIAYEMLCGRPPHIEQDWWALMAQIMTMEASHLLLLNPTVPEDVAWLVMSLLRRDAAERPKDADAVLQLIGQCRAGAQR